MTPALDDKDSYEELTDKQQQVVDELVEEPTAQNQDIAERADVSRSTVYNVKERYGDIVESRLNQHGRYQGQETTEGDPFGGELDTDQEWQTFDERPADQADDEGSVAEMDVLRLRLHRADIKQILLNGDVSEDLRRELINRVLESAFTDGER